MTRLPRSQWRNASPPSRRGTSSRACSAEGDHGCIFGHPGSGKSIVAPYLCYSVAAGEPFFGMRTRQGPTLYVANENPHGLKMRVRALAQRYGDQPLFRVTEAHDLLNLDSKARAKLLRYVEKHRPVVICLDTLAASFPG